MAENIRVLISYRDDGFVAEALEAAIDKRLSANITARKILAITIENKQVFDRLKVSELVEHIEEDQLMEAKVLPGGLREDKSILEGDREFQPYGIGMVQADQVWQFTEVDEDFKVCIVDTGYFVGHPDLPTVIQDQVRGTNTGSGVWAQDVQGHGTHCAGTIGAIGDNGRGVVGIRNNPNLFRFHIGKGLNNEGVGYESDILEAVQGCVDGGARVVSMSLGGSKDSKTAKNFYNDIYHKDGVLIVAAAGNDGNNGHAYPASYQPVLSVAAVDRNETRPSFSQCNKQVEIAAPGVNILSTLPGSTYGVASGTSMACPHVAGVAAEIWSRFPDCTNTQIRNVLLRSAKPIGDYGCYNGLGSGLIQAKAAYEMLTADGCEAGNGSGDDADHQQVVGGCPQNPDFIEAENPYYGKCPDSSSLVGLSRLLVVLSTVLFCFIV